MKKLISISITIFGLSFHANICLHVCACAAYYSINPPSQSLLYWWFFIDTVLLITTKIARWLRIVIRIIIAL